MTAPPEWGAVAPLLVGHLSPGVWRADGLAITPDALAAAAEGLGWTTTSGRLPATEDKAAYITALAQLAQAPSYVRGNWDSLADGLTDIAGTDATMLIVETTQPSSFDSMAVDILDEACRDWAGLGRSVQVAWFGPIAAPSLGHVGSLRAIRSDPAARTGRTPDR